MTGPLESLRQLTDQLLHSDQPVTLFAACNELHALCSRITELANDPFDPSVADPTELACGHAISPRNAAQCVVDFARTVAFIRGVDAALRELKRRFPGERLEVLYAGCGPFAPLILTQLDRYSPDDLRVTLLDIHQRSLDAAGRLVAEFGFAPFVAGSVQADAAAYLHPGAPHLIICEMLAQALRSEPQVAVTANLAPQLCEGGLFLPERITVDLCLGRPGREFGFEGMVEDRIALGRLMDLDSAAIHAGIATDLGPVAITLPNVDLPCYQPLLLTEVRVFQEIVLRNRDAGITYPLPVKIPDLAPDDVLAFTYVLGPNPHFAHRHNPGPS